MRRSASTANAFTFSVDSFIPVQAEDAAAQKRRATTASAIAEPGFQEVFNLGTRAPIPVRTGQSMDKFDDCAKASAKDFADTAKSGGLCPAWPNGMAIAPATEGAIKDAVSQFWNDDKVSVADAMKKIATAARPSKPNPRDPNMKTKPPHGGGNRRMRKRSVRHGRCRL